MLRPVQCGTCFFLLYIEPSEVGLSCISLIVAKCHQIGSYNILLYCHFGGSFDR